MDHGKPESQHDADGSDHADAAVNPVRFSRAHDIPIDPQAGQELVRLYEQEPKAIERHRTAEVRKVGR